MNQTIFSLKTQPSNKRLRVMRGSFRFWLTTRLVIFAVAIMVRLGIWQLDRLEQRRAFNARVQAQLAQPPLILNNETLRHKLFDMEYRTVIVQGEYDFANQVALRNQAYQNRWGVHLLTPLNIKGTDQAILVNRGWIPGEEFLSGNWSRFDQNGEVTVKGVIRRAQTKPDFGKRSDPVPAAGDPPLKAWNLANVGAIVRQIDYPIIPDVYIQQTEGEGDAASLPIPAPVELDLSEGPHLGYALQWFTFAAILGIGYPVFIKKRVGK
jgi:surfeit locus 1 family protein